MAGLCSFQLAAALVLNIVPSQFCRCSMAMGCATFRIRLTTCYGCYGFLHALHDSNLAILCSKLSKPTSYVLLVFIFVVVLPG